MSDFTTQGSMAALKIELERIEALLARARAAAAAAGLLVGDVNGPAGANLLTQIQALAGGGNQLVGVDNAGNIQVGTVPIGSFLFAVINSVNANAAVTTVSTAVFMSGLTADRTVTLPAVPVSGQIVSVKDQDGSLGNFDIIINGNGAMIDGDATYTMTAIKNGVMGAVMLVFNGVAWGLV